MDGAVGLDGQLAGLSLRVHHVAAPVREQVLQQLREAIVDMRLRPGQRLVERELVEQTGVSRATIREALRELAAEGLVQTIPHRGMVVASVSLERAAELYEVRAVLEGMAARQFVERATDSHVRKLKDAFALIEDSAHEPVSVVEMLAAKKAFYDALFEGAANPTIREIVEGLQARVTLLRRDSLVQPGRPEKTVREVRAIVDAIDAGDAELAAAASVRHVNEAARVILGQPQSRDPADP